MKSGDYISYDPERPLSPVIAFASHAASVEQFIQKLYPVMADKLFKPLGYKAPNVEVSTFPPTQELFEKVEGSTQYESKGDVDTPISIFINPMIRNKQSAAAALAHEMIHTIVAEKENGGHGPKFSAVHKKIGLIGRPEAAEMGPEFEKWYMEYASKL